MVHIDVQTFNIMDTGSNDPVIDLTIDTTQSIDSGGIVTTEQNTIEINHDNKLIHWQVNDHTSSNIRGFVNIHEWQPNKSLLKSPVNNTEKHPCTQSQSQPNTPSTHCKSFFPPNSKTVSSTGGTLKQIQHADNTSNSTIKSERSHSVEPRKHSKYDKIVSPIKRLRTVQPDITNNTMQSNDTSSTAQTISHTSISGVASNIPPTVHEIDSEISTPAERSPSPPVVQMRRSSTSRRQSGEHITSNRTIPSSHNTRIYRYLLDNLQRSTDELFYLCHQSDDIQHAAQVVDILQVCTHAFHKLAQGHSSSNKRTASTTVAKSSTLRTSPNSSIKSSSKRSSTSTSNIQHSTTSSIKRTASTERSDIAVQNHITRTGSHKNIRNTPQKHSDIIRHKSTVHSDTVSTGRKSLSGDTVCDNASCTVCTSRRLSVTNSTNILRQQAYYAQQSMYNHGSHALYMSHNNTPHNTLPAPTLPHRQNSLTRMVTEAQSLPAPRISTHTLHHSTGSPNVRRNSTTSTHRSSITSTPSHHNSTVQASPPQPTATRRTVRSSYDASVTKPTIASENKSVLQSPPAAISVSTKRTKSALVTSSPKRSVTPPQAQDDTAIYSKTGIDSAQDTQRPKTAQSHTLSIDTTDSANVQSAVSPSLQSSRLSMLASPTRNKRSTGELAANIEHKQMTAERIRLNNEQYKREKLNKVTLKIDELNKNIQYNNTVQKQHVEEKLQHAELKHSDYIDIIRKKAADENMKVRELQFITEHCTEEKKYAHNKKLLTLTEHEQRRRELLQQRATALATQQQLKQVAVLNKRNKQNSATVTHDAIDKRLEEAEMRRLQRSKRLVKSVSQDDIDTDTAIQTTNANTLTLEDTREVVQQLIDRVCEYAIYGECESNTNTTVDIKDVQLETTEIHNDNTSTTQPNTVQDKTLFCILCRVQLIDDTHIASHTTTKQHQLHMARKSSHSTDTAIIPYIQATTEYKSDLMSPDDTRSSKRNKKKKQRQLKKKLIHGESERMNSTDASISYELLESMQLYCSQMQLSTLQQALQGLLVCVGNILTAPTNTAQCYSPKSTLSTHGTHYDITQYTELSEQLFTSATECTVQLQQQPRDTNVQVPLRCAIATMLCNIVCVPYLQSKSIHSTLVLIYTLIDTVSDTVQQTTIKQHTLKYGFVIVLQVLNLLLSKQNTECDHVSSMFDLLTLLLQRNNDTVQTDTATATLYTSAIRLICATGTLQRITQYCMQQHSNALSNNNGMNLTVNKSVMAFITAVCQCTDVDSSSTNKNVTMLTVPGSDNGAVCITSQYNNELHTVLHDTYLSGLVYMLHCYTHSMYDIDAICSILQCVNTVATYDMILIQDIFESQYSLFIAVLTQCIDNTTNVDKLLRPCMTLLCYVTMLNPYNQTLVGKKLLSHMIQVCNTADTAYRSYFYIALHSVSYSHNENIQLTKQQLNKSVYTRYNQYMSQLCGVTNNSNVENIAPSDSIVDHNNSVNTDNKKQNKLSYSAVAAKLKLNNDTSNVKPVSTKNKSMKQKQNTMEKSMNVVVSADERDWYEHIIPTQIRVVLNNTVQNMDR